MHWALQVEEILLLRFLGDRKLSSVPACNQSEPPSFVISPLLASRIPPQESGGDLGGARTHSVLIFLCQVGSPSLLQGLLWTMDRHKACGK